MSKKLMGYFSRAGSILDIFGVSHQRSLHTIANKTVLDAFMEDGAALASDWRKVGQDIEIAIMAETNTQSQKRKSS